MTRAALWQPILTITAFLVVAGCGGGGETELDAVEPVAAAVTTKLSGVAIEVHQAPG